MSAREDYPAIAVLYDAWADSGKGQPEACRALEEIERLRRWKEEALTVLTGWEAVWHELGQPGTLGTSKSTACIREIRELKKDVTR